MKVNRSQHQALRILWTSYVTGDDSAVAFKWSCLVPAIITNFAVFLISPAHFSVSYFFCWLPKSVSLDARSSKIVAYSITKEQYIWGSSTSSQEEWIFFALHVLNMFTTKCLPTRLPPVSDFDVSNVPSKVNLKKIKMTPRLAKS